MKSALIQRPPDSQRTRRRLSERLKSRLALVSTSRYRPAC